MPALNESSTSKILKTLHRAFYIEGKQNLAQIALKTDAAASADAINVRINNRLIIADARAAKMQAALEMLGDRELAEANILSSNTNLGLDAMTKNKQALAYHATYATLSSPTLKKNQEEQLQADELKTRSRQHIEMIHKEIPHIHKQPAEMSAFDKISFIESEQKKLGTEIANLARKVKDTHKQLQSNLQGIRSVLPGLKISPTSSSEETPKPE